jgi:integrase
MKGKAVEKEWVKIASRPLFNLYQSTMESNLWQIRLNGSGGYLRRRFHAPSLNHALEAAPVVAGLEKSPEERNRISLADAFAMALKNTNRREKSRISWATDSAKFVKWLRKHHPLCLTWDQVTRSILREYLHSYDGKAANTKRLALQPILQTAGFMHREYGFANIGERFGIGSKLKTLPKTVYLEDVVSFCDFLKAHDSHLEVGACLQGLAGLQLLEALRLTWDKVDLKRGLIEISGEVKNEYRNRVIPVSSRVTDALRRLADRRKGSREKVRLLADHVVVGERGQAFEDHCSYGRQIRSALREWNPSIDWAPKDLRNCLLTYSVGAGLHGTVWEQYVGHAPKSVTERHYVPRLAVRSMGEENALLRQMDLFRNLVCQPVDDFIAKGGSCMILQVAVGDEAEAHTPVMA